MYESNFFPITSLAVSLYRYVDINIDVEICTHLCHRNNIITLIYIYLITTMDLGRSSGEGKGYPLQYSGLENSLGLWGPKESDMAERLSFRFTSTMD